MAHLSEGSCHLEHVLGLVLGEVGAHVGGNCVEQLLVIHASTAQRVGCESRVGACSVF